MNFIIAKEHFSYVCCFYFCLIYVYLSVMLDIQLVVAMLIDFCYYWVLHTSSKSEFMVYIFSLTVQLELYTGTFCIEEKYQIVKARSCICLVLLD